MGGSRCGGGWLADGEWGGGDGDRWGEGMQRHQKGADYEIWQINLLFKRAMVGWREQPGNDRGPSENGLWVRGRLGRWAWKETDWSVTETFLEKNGLCGRTWFDQKKRERNRGKIIIWKWKKIYIYICIATPRNFGYPKVLHSWRYFLKCGHCRNVENVTVKLHALQVTLISCSSLLWSLEIFYMHLRKLSGHQCNISPERQHLWQFVRATFLHWRISLNFVHKRNSNPQTCDSANAELWHMFVEYVCRRCFQMFRWQMLGRLQRCAVSILPSICQLYTVFHSYSPELHGSNVTRIEPLCLKLNYFPFIRTSLDILTKIGKLFTKFIV